VASDDAGGEHCPPVTLRLGWWFSDCKTLGGSLNWVFKVLVSGYEAGLAALSH